MKARGLSLLMATCAVLVAACGGGMLGTSATSSGGTGGGGGEVTSGSGGAGGAEVPGDCRTYPGNTGCATGSVCQPNGKCLYPCATVADCKLHAGAFESCVAGWCSTDPPPANPALGPSCAVASDCPAATVCTVAACRDEAGAGLSCVYVAVPQAPVADDAHCSLGDGGAGVCLGGVCASVPLMCEAPWPNGEVACPACDDGDPCTTDVCLGGVCSHVAVPDSTSCVLADYGDAGTVPGLCYGGFCCAPK